MCGMLSEKMDDDVVVELELAVDTVAEVDAAVERHLYVNVDVDVDVR